MSQDPTYPPTPAATPPDQIRKTPHQIDVVALDGVDGQALDWLRRRYEVAAVNRLDDVQPAAASIRALIVRNRTRVDAELLARLPNLEVVSRAGVGVDNLDLDALGRRGIVVTYVPDAATASVAELTLALGLCVAHRVGELDRLVRSGRWDRLPGRELFQDTWGILGLGRIGRRVAELAHGIGMRVIATDPAGTSTWDREFVSVVPFEQLLEESLVVSIHVPLSAATTRLIGRRELAAMRPDAILVNVARGPVVDEEALLEALMSGTISGAGLDVRLHEPPGPNDPFASLPQVVLTPHVGAFTGNAQARVLQTVVEDIDAVLRGDTPRNVVRPAV